MNFERAKSPENRGPAPLTPYCNGGALGACDDPSQAKVVSFPPLSAQGVLVWRVDLGPSPTSLERFVERLTAEEQQRADRFVRPPDRRRFTISHAALRMVLGRYLDVSPERVALAIGPRGKPELASSSDSSPLRFNLSHSEGLALIALTLGGEVGVDVEHVRPLTDVESLVGRYFAPGEQTAWHTLPEDKRLEGFFRCWTRKEAYLKAHGVGLSGSLDHFEVSLLPGQPARLIRDDDRPDANTRWRLHDIPVEEGYLAACAVERGIEKISILDWPLHKQ